MISIAIDGPSGAGKSTIAKIIAKERGFIYLDTGAMYRAFGLYAIENGIDINNVSNEELIALLSGFKIDIQYVDGQQYVIVNGKNVNNLIRTPEVSLAASKVATIPEVRLSLIGIQREIAQKNNVVMDGRDIGTFVLKDADVKIFLTATVEDRAIRRYEELLEKGNKDITFDEVLNDMILRDENDSKRSFTPLAKADDAIEINTTGFKLEQSIEVIRKVVQDKLCGF